MSWTKKQMSEVLERFWKARSSLYNMDAPGMTDAKYRLYEMMDDLFGPIQYDPYHKIYDEIRKNRNK